MWQMQNECTLNEKSLHCQDLLGVSSQILTYYRIFGEYTKKRALTSDDLFVHCVLHVINI